MLRHETLIAEGGPAFPCHNDADREYNYLWRGMTLRDWFAGQALSGLATAGASADFVASEAYKLADAMLNAREV